MCDTCGCNVTDGNRHLISDNGKLARSLDGQQAIDLLHGLLDENNHQAAHNRRHFQSHGVLAINLMSSPGAGKTSLLEATIDALKSEFAIGVIEGDLETENDAERIRAKGVAAVQICTGSACHLDAHLVHDALHQLELDQLDILFIENVGNLVCPASFDLGQTLNITLLSVPEGDDKPAKYPVMFRAADQVLITKADLLPYLEEFSIERARNAIKHLATNVAIQILSSKSGEGFADWCNWLSKQTAALKQSRECRSAEQAHSHHPHEDPYHSNTEHWHQQSPARLS